jgi:hypothetical protein
MTDETKIKMMEALAKSGMSVGQFVMENTGTITYNDNRGAEKQEKKDGGSQSGSKEAIMEYVGRLKPVVREQYRNEYDTIWEGILELTQVRTLIYNKGKQQDTTFNRNLVAQIIHQVSDWLYLPTANTVKMAEYLEPEKGIEHPVRQKLGESPEKDVKKAIEAYVKEKK